MNFKSALILTGITFCLKLGLVFYFADIGQCSASNNPSIYFSKVGKISFIGGDTPSYLGAIENLIAENEYYFWNGVRKVYAGRMPYYGVPYYLLRLAFDKSTASDLLIVWQLIFSSLAALCLARLCFKITGSVWCFCFGYAFYFLNFNLFALDLMLVPESLSLSFTVFFLYCCYLYRVEKKASAFFTASLFLAILTLLKPYFVLLYPVLLIDLAVVNRIFTSPDQKKKITAFAVKSLIAGSLLIVLLLPWAIRNFVVLNKVIFSQEDVYAGYNYTESELAFRRFTAAWGSDDLWFNPQSRNPTYYFLKPYSDVHDRIKLPSSAFADGYNVEDVERVRRDYLRLQNEYSPESDASVAAQFDRLTAIYKNERPFMYYVGSNFIASKKFLLHTNSQFLLSFTSVESACDSGWHLIFRIVSAVVYLISILFGFAGIGILLVKKRISVMFAAVPLFLILYFAFYDGHTDARYFIQAFPALLSGAIFVLNYLISKQKRFIERHFFPR